jgi:hypothetical protein
MGAPMRRTRSTCCARAASGHVAAPPISMMIATLQLIELHLLPLANVTA